MSFGKSSSGSKQTMDPVIRQNLLDVFNEGKKLSKTTYQPYQGWTVAPMSPFQQEGMQATVDAARSGIGQNEMTHAINTTSAATGYQPAQVGANMVDTSIDAGGVVTQGVGPVQGVQTQSVGPVQGVQTQGVGPVRDVAGQQVSAGAIGPLGQSSTVDPERIAAGQFADTSLDPYMSQYQTGAIDAVLGDIERQRQMQQDQNAAAAQQGGAFGGDRHAIVEAETNRAALAQGEKTARQMRQSGFESAARLAEADLARRMDASTANQATNLQGQLANQAGSQFDIGQDFSRQATNLDAGLQAALANQNAGMQAALANQQADIQTGMADQGTALQASLANQDANLRAGMADQDTALQASLANQERDLRSGMADQSTALQASLANQQTRLAEGQEANRGYLANQDAALRAALANQEAGMQGNLQRLAAAQQLAGMGQDRRGMVFDDAAMMQGVGNQQQQFAQQLLDDQYRRYQEQQNWPFRMFDVLRSGAGMLPNPTMSSSRSRGFNLGLMPPS